MQFLVGITQAIIPTAIGQSDVCLVLTHHRHMFDVIANKQSSAIAPALANRDATTQMPKGRQFLRPMRRNANASGRLYCYGNIVSVRPISK